MLHKEFTSRAELFDHAKVAEDIRIQCINAPVIYLPWKKPFGYEKPAFPEVATELYQFLEDGLAEGDLELASSDEDFLELAEHAEIVTLGVFLATTIILPTLSGLLVEFIKQRYMTRKDKPTVRLTLWIEPTNGDPLVTWDYEGPADQLESALKQIPQVPALKEAKDQNK